MIINFFAMTMCHFYFLLRYITTLYFPFLIVLSVLFCLARHTNAVLMSTGNQSAASNCLNPRRAINNLVLSFLVQEGYKDAAAKFAEEAGLSGDDFKAGQDCLEQRSEITSAIHIGEIDKAVDLIEKSYPGLLTSNSHLIFQLQQLKVIELIRQKKVGEAVTFAREHFSDIVVRSPELLEELEKTLFLLVIKDPASAPPDSLLHRSYNLKVASEVNKTLSASIVSNLPNIVKLYCFAQSECERVSPNSQLAKNIFKS